MENGCAKLFAGGHILQPESCPEFNLILAQARKEAVALVGPHIADLVFEIAPDTIRRAIRDLLSDLMACVEGDERNVILTLARKWVTLETGQFLSKDAAADWAALRSSDETKRILDLARDAYLGDIDDDLHHRKTEVSQTSREIADRILAIL